MFPTTLIVLAIAPFKLPPVHACVNTQQDGDLSIMPTSSNLYPLYRMVTMVRCSTWQHQDSIDLHYESLGFFFSSLCHLVSMPCVLYRSSEHHSHADLIQVLIFTSQTRESILISLTRDFTSLTRQSIFTSLTRKSTFTSLTRESTFQISFPKTSIHSNQIFTVVLISRFMEKSLYCPVG